MNPLTFCFTDTKETKAVTDLLAACGLPTEDIAEHLKNFIIAKDGNRIIGVIGLQPLGNFGLLRSLAVAPSHRKRGLAQTLYARISACARRQGITDLYLLTLTAEDFFTKLGFRKIKRETVPAEIQATAEFRALCPSSAVCMAKRITEEVQYYPKDLLALKSDVPGAGMWAVALDKTMLTYFEVRPHSRFDTHRHESEQITLVLNGELFFEMNGKTFCVKKAEAIAIPSNVPHAVFTREKPTKAVDAWSPVMDRYRDKSA